MTIKNVEQRLEALKTEFQNYPEPGLKAGVTAALAEMDSRIQRELEPLRKRIEELEKQPVAGTNFDPEKFISALHKYLKDQLAPRFKRIEALEREIKEIREKGLLRYRGVHQRTQFYEAGSVCTHQGSGWVALADTQETPGEGKSWQLFCKGSR
jgi:hypothetical protein